MHHRLDSFLSKNNILYENQYGFRRGRSCEQALLSAQNSILDNLNKKQITLLLLIDFSKAFDMVDHDILLRKLSHYGIRGIALKWFESYLKNREQYTHVNNVNSKTGKLAHGVPQGSILGPLLFIIYANDLPNIHKALRFILYADDANILIVGRDMNEIKNQLDQLTSALINWVNTNGLSLNIKKTKYMLFANTKIPSDFTATMANVPIERTSVARFLGVLVDENLTWKQHIATLQTKMTRNAGILLRLKGILPISILKTLYHSFIQSQLNHCPLIWGLGNKNTLNPLFTAQKRAIRTLIPGFANYFYNKKTGEHPHHTKAVFAQHGIQTVHNLILQRALTFMHKVINHLTPAVTASYFHIDSHPPVADALTQTRFIIPTARLKPHKNSVFAKGPSLFNNIIPLIPSALPTKHNPTLMALPKPFKNCIKAHLMKQQALGDPNEWTITNFSLYIGTRKSLRIAAHSKQI